MKIKTLLLVLLCAIPFATLLEGGHRSHDGNVASGIALLAPKIDADFSDLDVRDAQNKPVQQSAASQELEVLFHENLIILTLFARPHISAEVYSWLNSFSHLFNRSIFTRLLIVFGHTQEAYFPPTKRFVHNVHNLWITPQIEHAVSGSPFAATRFPQTANRLILRC